MKTSTNSLTQAALRKFKKNRTGVLSLLFIACMGLVAVFAYLIAPDNSSNSNQMHLEIHYKKPGFEALILSVPSSNSSNQSFLNKLITGNKNSAQEIVISSYEIEDSNIRYYPYNMDGQKGMEQTIGLAEFQGKTIDDCVTIKKFYLGTDKYGRDLLSRMIIGARISFFIGFIAVFISLLIGITIGGIAGYFGGKTDAFIMWLINITWSIPTLLLVIAITLALGKGYWQVFIAVGLTMWVEVARVVRGQMMSARELQYVEAARALGFSNLRIIFKHILPNIMAPVIVISAANFAAAILIESGLSFLGIGAQPPTPSWGGMIKDHYSYIILGKAYLAVIPGLAIMSLVMAFMLIGNALRDALDVKS